MQKLYEIVGKIAEGSYGQIILVLKKDTLQRFILKVQKQHSFNHSFTPLMLEYKIMQEANRLKISGVPTVYQIGKYNNLLAIRMDQIGLDLYNSAKQCRYTAININMLANQMLNTLKSLHNLNIIHRDIKPQNILCKDQNRNQFYLIDYGIAIRRTFKDELKLQPSKVPFFYGTYKFSSMNAHKNLQQCQRDDLESLGYVILYLQTGTLRWLKIHDENIKQKNKKILNQKIQFRNRLQKNFEISQTLKNYFKKIYSYQFNQPIDYQELINCFSSTNQSKFIPRQTKKKFELDMDTLDSRKEMFNKKFKLNSKDENQLILSKIQFTQQTCQQETKNKISNNLKSLSNMSLMKPKFLEYLQKNV